MSKVVKATKVTAEEAEAFRERVRKQNAELANWVVIPIDDVIAALEDPARAVKTYVTQQPNSQTNRTGFYRVVEYREWTRYFNGDTSFLNAANFNSQEEADAERDRLNGEIGDEGSS